jgi:hypothetical protein
LENGYDIDKTLRKYYYMEKDAVLQWITISSGIPCHFAWIMYEKDNNNNIIRGLIHDNCYYDNINDPQFFGIGTVLDNADSAAAQAMNSGKPEPVTKYSTIDGKEYYCYAHYEDGHSKELRNSAIPGSVTVHYARLLVIGWDRVIYDTMKRFSNLFRESQRE